ncbi:MAG: hypothetical protein SH809_04490 [Rhodothermales bacterium]|nr:hypothetical protein [Rhodothermales bacterium]
MKLLFLLCATILHCVLPARVSGQSPLDSPWLALVRADGIILPIARYSKGTWNRLPNDEEWWRYERFPDKWFVRSVLPGFGYSRTEAYVTETVQLGWLPPELPYTGILFGLISDYPGVSMGGFVMHPIPKIGIASDVELEIYPMSREIQVVRGGTDDTLDELAAYFVEQEIEENMCSSIEPIERAKTALAMDLFSGSLSGVTVYRFVARKRYRATTKGRCDENAYMSGWIVKRQTGETHITREQPTLRSDPDPNQSIYEKPLGIMAHDGKVFVVTETRLYEGEGFGLYEVLGDSIVNAFR